MSTYKNLHPMLEQKDLNNICRLCLVEEHSLRKIYGTKIPSMIQFCSKIKILYEDNLPTLICVRCLRQIINFYTFKRRIEKNYQILQKFLRNKSKTKDIINMALEKSDISPSELNETQKVDGKSNCNNKKVINATKNENIIKGVSKGSQQNISKSVYCDKIQDLSIGTNIIVNQTKQTTFCPNYKSEPPPLVPLHTISESNFNSDNQQKNLKIQSTIFENSLKSNTVLPPPLVPISLVEEDANTAKTTNQAVCSKCRKEFDSWFLLKDHKMKNNCKFNGQQCNICKKRFMDAKKLINHLKGHKMIKEYLCNICGKGYSSPSTLRIHFRSHTGERPFKCNICGKGFVRWAGVKNHLVTHQDFKPYKCETCGKEFKVISNLYRHQRLHTGSYKFNCSFCSKKFCQSDHLKLHIRTYHTNEKPYLCCECGKGFVSFQRLKRHELVHSGQKPYPCTLCLRGYSNAIDLKNHHFRVHNKNGNIDELKKYACSLCGLGFRHPCRLTKHMKTHEDLNKKCQACGQTFKSIQVLARHLESSICKNITQGVQPAT